MLPLLSFVLGSLGFAVVCSQHVQAQTQAQTIRSLSEAVVELAATHQLDLVYDPALLAGKTTAFVLYEAPVEDLLRALLEPAGLTFRRLASGTYTLLEKEQEALPTGRLRGTVLDHSTQEPLIGAHVRFPTLGLMAATDEHGQFTLPRALAGALVLEASHVGYRARHDTVYIRPAATVDIALDLKPEPISISPLIIEESQYGASRSAFNAFFVEQGFALSSNFGSPDLMRSLNNLMGVRVSDAMADVHVQGGEAGEHQFRLDGAPLFEPVHLRGLLGAFNPFAIQKISVHKAGFGATEGSHIAGVIEAQHTVDSPDGRVLDVQLDQMSLNVRGHAEAGTPGKNHLQMMVAGRTSLWEVYQPTRLKQLLRAWNTPDPFLPRASVLAIQDDDPKFGAQLIALLDSLHLTPVGDPDLSFRDLHGAARIWLGTKHRLFASFYKGWNQLGGNRLSLQVDTVTFNPKAPSNQDRYAWNNAVAQVQHTAMLHRRLLLNTRLRSSNYTLSHEYTTLDNQNAVRFFLTPDLELREVRLIEDVTPTDDGNRVRMFALEHKADYAHGDRSTFQIGTEATLVNHRFSIEDVYFRPIALRDNNWFLAFFAEEAAALGKHLTVTAGSRFTFLTSHRKFYAEPRLEIRLFGTNSLLGNWSVRTATGIYRQFVNQFDISSVSPSALLPSIRFWLPVDAAVTPPKAVHGALDVEIHPSTRWTFRAEGYYKDQPNLLLIDYPALWTNLRDATVAETQAGFLREGRGYGYGVGVGVQYKMQQVSVGARYEYNMAKRTSVFAQTNTPLRVSWNEPHRFEVAIDWTPSPNFIATARWRSTFGRAWGFRQAYYDYLATDPLTEPLYGEFNLREPTRHTVRDFYQLDLGAAYTQTFGRIHAQVRIDLLNALDRTNVVDWRLEALNNGTTNEYRRVSRTLLERTPTVAMRLRW